MDIYTRIHEVMMDLAQGSICLRTAAATLCLQEDAATLNVLRQVRDGELGEDAILNLHNIPMIVEDVPANELHTLDVLQLLGTLDQRVGTCPSYGNLVQDDDYDSTEEVTVEGVSYQAFWSRECAQLCDVVDVTLCIVRPF